MMPIFMQRVDGIRMEIGTYIGAGQIYIHNDKKNSSRKNCMNRKQQQLSANNTRKKLWWKWCDQPEEKSRFAV